MSNPIRWLEDVIISTSRFAVSRDLPDYSDLQTVIRLTETDRKYHPDMDAPFIMVTEDGAYCTVYTVAGSYCETDELADPDKPHSWEGRIKRMTQVLSASYSKFGHKISMVFETDPARGAEEIRALLEPQYASVRRTKIDMSAILDERVEKLSPWVARERCYLVCYTGREALSSHELRDEYARLGPLIERSPQARFGQNPILAELIGLKIRHTGFLNAVEKAFHDSGNGVMLQMLDAHAAGNALRSQVDRIGTSPHWQPLLPDDRIVPRGSRQGEDHTPFLAPWLKFQVMNVDVEAHGAALLVNGMWHGSLSVVMGPQNPQSFAKLKALVPRSVPWRVRMDLMPGGLEKLKNKKRALDFTAFMPALRPVWESIGQLVKVAEEEPVCAMTIMVSTWGDSPEAITRNLTLLTQAFQAWGSCDVTQTFGNPFRAWTSTLVAASKASGLHLIYPPLSEALKLLPITRPASAWQDDGNALFPTLDGKLFPVGLATTKQNKLTSVISGAPGLGKSVLLNHLGNVSITSAQHKLPFFAGVDKGFSMQGQAELLRDSLPEDRKDEVIGFVLENSSDQCRNLFDIQLGAKFPITPERNTMINILSVLCSDPGEGAPPNHKDTLSILERALTAAFQANAEKAPRLWSHGVIEPVDNALMNSGVFERQRAISPDWWETATWYEVRDLLFEVGYVNEAQLAQYQAVPELADMSTVLNDEDMKTAYGKVVRDGSSELLLDYLKRCLTDACEAYKMFAGRTRLMISPMTRVISIDLNNVMGDTTKAGHLKSGLMFLFAGAVAGGHFSLPQYRDELMDAVAPLYRALHLDRLEQLDQEIKTKIYDELHNAAQANFIFPMLETQDREQRKFGIRTVLSSQYIRDFPKAVLASANSLFMMEVDPADEAMLKTNFHVPDVTIKTLQRAGSGAAADGSGVPFLGVFRIKGGSTLSAILKNALGPLELWALNSAPEDTPLRRLLYQQVGGVTARAILADAFPQGSAAKLIAVRRQKMKENDDSNVVRALADELVAKRGYNI